MVGAQGFFFSVRFIQGARVPSAIAKSGCLCCSPPKENSEKGQHEIDIPKGRRERNDPADPQH